MKTQIVNNFIDEEDCQTIINRLEELISNNDVVVRPDGRVGILNKEDDVISPLVEKYKNKAIQTFNDQFVNFSGYIATKYVPGIGMDIHIDSQEGEEMGVLMYLNDDYVGGELTFTTPDGENHSISPKKGDAVYCPSWYPHGVNKVTEGNRYFFTVSLMNNPI
jgi:predicted 2-oxoglutarate/Fe(II)-dependent dioxygenase YbiX